MLCAYLVCAQIMAVSSSLVENSEPLVMCPSDGAERRVSASNFLLRAEKARREGLLANAAENYSKAWRTVPECRRYHRMRFNALEQGIWSLALGACQANGEEIRWARQQLTDYEEALERMYSAGTPLFGRRMATQLRRRVEIKATKCLPLEQYEGTASTIRGYSDAPESVVVPASRDTFRHVLVEATGRPGLPTADDVNTKESLPWPYTRRTVRAWAFSSLAIATLGTAITALAERRIRDVRAGCIGVDPTCDELHPAANVQSFGTFLFGFSVGSVTGGLTMLFTGKDRRRAWIAESLFGAAAVGGGSASTAIAARYMRIGTLDESSGTSKTHHILMQDLGAALLGVGSGLVVSTLVNALVVRMRGRWRARRHAP